VLGVAQDGGVPHLGCHEGACAAVRRGERRAEKVAALGLLSDDGRAWLVDATPDLPAQVDALGVRLPAGVLLTHAHVGHYTGLVHFGTEVAATRDLPVHATPRMQAFLSAHAPWSALVSGGNVRLLDNTEVQLGPVRVRALPVPHRDELSDTVGYLFEGPRARVLYVPDIDRWELWDRDLEETVLGVDHALLDGTFLSAAELPHRDLARVRHPLVTDTMDRLEGLGERVWFTHLNHTNPLLLDPSPVTRRGFRVAYEGLDLEL
jgi:pyrroloquinoline quinone biosynthesis protein B